MWHYAVHSVSAARVDILSSTTQLQRDMYFSSAVRMGHNVVHSAIRVGASIATCMGQDYKGKEKLDSKTQRARAYEVTSFLSTNCELSTEMCSTKFIVLVPVL